MCNRNDHSQLSVGLKQLSSGGDLVPFTSIKITLKKHVHFLKYAVVYNTLFQSNGVLAFERTDENASLGKAFVQRITAIFFMHITMVIELFAIDSKVYSTNLLPFSIMWFLAKNAICQFKIYSMTFSSCRCGLKA